MHIGQFHMGSLSVHSTEVFSRANMAQTCPFLTSMVVLASEHASQGSIAVYFSNTIIGIDLLVPSLDEVFLNSVDLWRTLTPLMMVRLTVMA